MRDPFTQPFSEGGDLGLAIPESDHGVSVCLPRWAHVIGYEEGDPETGWKCWQHGGEIVSSRLAESALTDEPLDPAVIAAGAKATATLRERIASFHDAASADDVFLFSPGMAAIFAVHRILTKGTPDEPTIQIEFPYLDSFQQR
ncbi:MAG: hypothetical protein NWQ35_06160 [Verrucomicrobiales bacterium]|nr:hypothetical protein [Verrucomicrobiales bacterium]